MVTCPSCQIGLADTLERCPLCQRLVGRTLRKRQLLLFFGFSLVLLVLAGLVASSKLQKMVLRAHATPADAYTAAVAYLKKTPEFHEADGFSKQKETVIERWGPTRYRIAGYVVLHRNPGTQTHNYYSCVLSYTGRNGWQVEDFHVERVE